MWVCYFFWTDISKRVSWLKYYLAAYYSFWILQAFAPGRLDIGAAKTAADGTTDEKFKGQNKTIKEEEEDWEMARDFVHTLI